MSYVVTYFPGSSAEHDIYYKDSDCKIIHREDGPAVMFVNGYQEWCIDGRHHRENGPARVWPDYYEEYYLNDKKYEEEEYWAIIKLGAFV